MLQPDPRLVRAVMAGNTDELVADLYGDRTADAARVAKSKATSAKQAGWSWEAALLRTKGGEIRPVLANAMIALKAAQEWTGVLAYDEFSLNVCALKKTPWGYAGPWNDQQDRLFTDWAQRRGIFIPVEVGGQAVQAAAMDTAFHPVRDYLTGLEWDGVPRLDSWLVRYLGAEDSPYIRAVGARWLIGAAARVMRPGTKLDTCLVLEGKQGAGKSTAFQILGSPWFADELAEMGTKDAAIQTRGVWIIELAELSALTRGEREKVKAFLSRQVDRFRLPYGKRASEHPRQCCFGGTTNADAYLQDETGARRFWPVRCGRIDLDALRTDRDQLWAEAVTRFHEGAAWWLEADEGELQEAAAEEQAARYIRDPWEEVVDRWLVGRSDVTTGEVLERALNTSPERQTKGDQMRVAACLRTLGWNRRKIRTGAKVEWRYERA
ncbi:virulence-associated E family protein [uncultured Paludibaculum sp.]|uniref:virulence-associated E family protein n=1 Tax=uncultured Paludibaculum sp. TaxID=1765020 RepID=UPI002AAB0563|nr:virulence-associated E family protein [uncultured Paludibaculum sp.]